MTVPNITTISGPQTLFKTAQQIAASTPDRPDYLVRGLIARGCLTELSGKVKGGKTTWIGHMVSAIRRGAPFLGYATCSSPVLYLTEEREGTMRAMLQRCGLLEETDLHVLSFYQVSSYTWEECVALAEAQAETVGAGLLIIDTLSKWARIVNENDTGEAQAAMAPLEAVASRGLAVLVNRHDRKSGGEVGESGRGASAFSGAADILLHLQRANVEGHANRRILAGIGRFDDVPEQIVIELKDGSYVNLGDEIEVERAEARLRLKETLSTSKDAGMVEADIIEALKPISRGSVRRALEDGRKEGWLFRDKGFGQRGTAFGFWLPTTDHLTQRSDQYVGTHVIKHDVPLPSRGGNGHALRSDQPTFPNGQEESAETCAACGSVALPGSDLCRECEEEAGGINGGDA